MFTILNENKNKIGNSDYLHRIERISRIEQYLKNNNNRIELFDSMYKDLHKCETEVIISELMIVQSHISHIKKYLHNWMKYKSIKSPFPLLGVKSYIFYQSKGIVLIISPWNYPINLSLIPLIYSIAAGNTIIMKPSEISANTSAYIKKMIEQIFEKNEVAVIEGGISTSEELLQYPFNHIFFTGSSKVGKIIMEKASKNLSSITLELGGKSPCIIDETVDIPVITHKLVWAKYINNGQTCISPDYIILHKSKYQEFISEFKKSLHKLYDPYQTGINYSQDYGRIINYFHFNRLNALYNDAIKKGATVILGGLFGVHDLYMEPTLIENVNFDMDIMHEEIFGPLIPLITYENINEIINVISKNPNPLTLYIASNNKSSVEYIIKNVQSGGVVINDYMLGYSNPYLPFGGINQSGIGKSFGFDCFEEFSNKRSIIERKWGNLSIIYPPYDNKKKKIIDLLQRFI